MPFGGGQLFFAESYRKIVGQVCHWPDFQTGYQPARLFFLRLFKKGNGGDTRADF